MRLIKTLRTILTSKHPHFISVDVKTYNRWGLLIKLAVLLNKNYKSCEIFRRRYKIMQNFVVIGLKYNGRNVKRRTSGFAKEFLIETKNPKCIYCGSRLHKNNATADHIIPISKGGNNTQVNLVVCCKDCNSERGNLDFNQYLLLKNKNIDRGKKIFI